MRASLERLSHTLWACRRDAPHAGLVQDPMESIAPDAMGMSAMHDESHMGGGLSGLGGNSAMQGGNSAMHGTVNMAPPASLTPPGMVPGVFQSTPGSGAAGDTSQEGKKGRAGEAGGAGTRAMAAEDPTSLPQQSMVAGAVAQQV